MDPEKENKLLKKAFDLLSKKAYTEKGLFEKLSKASGAEPDDARAVAEVLTSRGFVNDAVYADDFIRAKLELNQWGGRKIRIAMIKKGFSSETIIKAFEKVETGKEIESAKLVIKKIKIVSTNSFEQKQKVIKKLAARGFDYGTIKSALDSIARQES